MSETFAKKPANGGTPARENKVIIVMGFIIECLWEKRAAYIESIVGGRGKNKANRFRRTTL